MIVLIYTEQKTESNNIIVLLHIEQGHHSHVFAPSQWQTTQRAQT